MVTSTEIAALHTKDVTGATQTATTMLNVMICGDQINIPTTLGPTTRANVSSSARTATIGTARGDPKEMNSTAATARTTAERRGNLQIREFLTSDALRLLSLEEVIGILNFKCFDNILKVSCQAKEMTWYRIGED